MSHFHGQNQYGQGQPPATDEFGNAIPDPVRHTVTPGTGQHGTTTTTRGLRRPGSSSSSSSSSEEDEQGMRRKKKGMKEKIKEKIPGVGGHHDQPSYATTATTPAGYEVAAEHHHEKKGIMDKVKDKIPGIGTHHQSQHN